MFNPFTEFLGIKNSSVKAYELYDKYTEEIIGTYFTRREANSHKDSYMSPSKNNKKAKHALRIRMIRTGL